MRFPGDWRLVCDLKVFSYNFWVINAGIFNIMEMLDNLIVRCYGWIWWGWWSWRVSPLDRGRGFHLTHQGGRRVSQDLFKDIFRRADHGSWWYLGFTYWVLLVRTLEKTAFTALNKMSGVKHWLLLSVPCQCLADYSVEKATMSRSVTWYGFWQTTSNVDPF